MRDTQVVSSSLSELLERSRQLAALGDSLAGILSSSRGRLVLVGGEAGVGKTALVSRFCEEHGRSARILWSACDALFTPRPLGPLLDVAQVTGGELEELVESSAIPHEVAAALMGELRTHSPTILVMEDLHWADEATLDVLKLLARRIEGAPALILASYRDELDRAHPLRFVLGEFASDQAVERLKLEPLSPVAVATLAEPHGVDADELYRKTEGNPFFVTEVLAGGDGEIPETVRDAVLARAARLSSAARTLLEAAAVVPPPVELWLLETLAAEVADQLDECLTSGMLTATSVSVAFRHELARLAVEESVAPNRRVGLHQKALAALADPPTGAPELARLAHHAEAAGDREAVLEFAPAAAAQAASRGAHQEAAAQYARALRFAEQQPLEARAKLLKRRSFECYLTDQADEAVEAQRGAIECYRQLGDGQSEGDTLRGLSSTLWCPGRIAEATQAGREAVALLEQLPPGHELAMAYSNVSKLCAAAEDAEGARVWGTRAIELAEHLDDTEALNNALIWTGRMEFVAGAPGGEEKLLRSLKHAQQARLQEHAALAYLNLAWGAFRQRSYALANRYVEAGIENCSEHGIDLFLYNLLAIRARAELDQGRWSEAVSSALPVLHGRCIATFPRSFAFVVLGLVRARSGDPEVWPALDEALALTEPSGDLEMFRIAPVAAARAEAAWLEGKHELVAEETEAALDLAVERQASWLIGELAYWRWRAGIREEIPPDAAEPYALQMRGEWERAATLWVEIGCPYEAALALSNADDDDALRRALAEFQRLGARTASAIVARRLRKRGDLALPRGPRPTTQQNPANLTARELEVLALVAQGLRNAEIAERLFIAQKTVDSHVSAILRKLNVPTRGHASAEAVRLGLTCQDQ